MDSGGTEVAKGKYVVPNGVAVEELDGGKKKLSEQCPPALKTLLENKGLVPVYDKMVASIVEEGNTRNVFGRWKDKEFDSILDLFRTEFAERGVKVALCKRSSGSGAHRWIEFIDEKSAPAEYIPMYDVANNSGQVIKTIYNTLEFPYGVAVEELKQWKGKQKLSDRIPIYVEKMLNNKNLMIEYEQLIESLIHYGVGQRFKCWNIDKIKDVIAEYRPKFQTKNVDLFISHKQEYVSHGQYGGHMEYFRWLEFVDREEQPTYYPQRDAETKDEKCSIM